MPLPDPLLLTNYTSWLTPKPPLTLEHFDDEPTTCLTFSEALVPYLLTLIETALWTDKWKGEIEQQENSVRVMRELQFALMEGNCMTDPCCPETNELLTENNTLLRRLLLVQQQAQIIHNQTQQIISNQYSQVFNYMDDGDDYHSYAPDAPEKWDYDSTDLTPEATLARSNALCAAVTSYVAEALRAEIATNVFEDVLEAGLIIGAITAIVLSAGVLAIPLGIVAAGVHTFTAAKQAALQNEGAIRKVICCMINGLKGQDISYDSFKHSVNDCGFTSPSDESLIAGVIDTYNQSRDYYRSFVYNLDRYKNAVQANAGAGAYCDCDCDGAELESYGEGQTGIITKYSDCIYRFQQPAAVSGCWYIQVRDILGRCIRFEVADGHEVQAVSDHAVIGCCGETDSETVGGFAPHNGTNFAWRLCDGPIDAWYKVTLVAEEDCE